MARLALDARPTCMQGQLALQPVSIVFVNSWSQLPPPPPASYGAPVRGHLGLTPGQPVGVLRVAQYHKRPIPWSPACIQKLLWVDYFAPRADQDSASVRSLHLLEVRVCAAHAVVLGPQQLASLIPDALCCPYCRSWCSAGLRSP